MNTPQNPKKIDNPSLLMIQQPNLKVLYTDDKTITLAIDHFPVALLHANQEQKLIALIPDEIGELTH